MYDILGCYCYNLEWFGNEVFLKNMLIFAYIFFHKCVCHEKQGLVTDYSSSLSPSSQSLKE